MWALKVLRVSEGGFLVAFNKSSSLKKCFYKWGTKSITLKIHGSKNCLVF